MPRPAVDMGGIEASPLKPARRAVSDTSPWMHMAASATGGSATSIATAPLDVRRTRLQSDFYRAQPRPTLGQLSTPARRHCGNLDCVRQVLRREGVPGLYRGLTASYLGTVETACHLMLYERFKVLFRFGEPARGGNRDSQGDNPTLLEELAAGTAELAASLMTYPHEVARTRLRQAPLVDGRPRYTGLVQCFASVWAQEGWRGLYGGLTPHVVRSIPSAATTLGVYEFVLRLVGVQVPA